MVGMSCGSPAGGRSWKLNVSTPNTTPLTLVTAAGRCGANSSGPAGQRLEKVTATRNHEGAPADGCNTLAIATMVFQLRVVAGTPKSRSNVPR